MNISGFINRDVHPQNFHLSISIVKKHTFYCVSNKLLYSLQAKRRYFPRSQTLCLHLVARKNRKNIYKQKESALSLPPQTQQSTLKQNCHEQHSKHEPE